jgi:signal transduction histidine kinase/ActR/RegA family two-component response regulator
MPLRWRSLSLVFPVILTGLVLVVAGLFVYAAQTQMRSVLLDETAQRLREAGSRLAPYIGGPSNARRRATDALQRHPAVAGFYGAPRDTLAVAQVLDSVLGQPTDTSGVAITILDEAGRPLFRRARRGATSSYDWALERIARGAVRTQRFSPLRDENGIATFEILTRFPLVEDRPVRYLLETREAIGRGQNAIRALMGAETFLVGHLDGGVWTDLSRIQPPPPAIAAVDSLLRFEDSPRGPVVGVASRVEESEWVVWLEVPTATVLAPVSRYLERVLPLAAALIVLGALGVWLVTRELTTRLTRLTEEVDRVEAGANAVASLAPPPTIDGDELDRLEAAFARMAERLEYQQRLETQLTQSRRLEAIGRLTGGIAHDFNNVLTALRNYAELVRAELTPGSEAAADIEEVLRTTDRATSLTRQLLAFSRQQSDVPRRIDLNAVVIGLQRMLQRLIPSNITFATALAPNLPNVRGDLGRLEQVLLNLVLNAADAMPDGGTLTVETRRGTALDALDSQPNEVPVILAVRDTGSGMDAETAAHIFEPFFTTKPSGKGTGLGLSTVQGVVEQSGGRIRVESVPGAGSLFEVTLPLYVGEDPGEPLPRPSPQGMAPITLSGIRMSEAPTPPPAVEARTSAPRRGLTILVVEDEEATRAVVSRLLVAQGHEVIEAEQGQRALEILSRRASSIDLVLSDVMMPGMSGVELAERVEARWMDLPVALMSGYAEQTVTARPDGRGNRPILQKPFSPERLADYIATAAGRITKRTATP